jgi:hypothetical protein
MDVVAARAERLDRHGEQRVRPEDRHPLSVLRRLFA